MYFLAFAGTLTGIQKLLRGRLRSRDHTHLECGINLVNILLQTLCYPPLARILPSDLVVKTKKIEKRSSLQNLRLLIAFTRSVMLFHRKAFVVTCSWEEVCWSSSAIVQKFTLAWGSKHWFRGTAPKCPCPRGAGPVTYFWGTNLAWGTHSSLRGNKQWFGGTATKYPPGAWSEW